jgi:TPR repeat protein
MYLHGWGGAKDASEGARWVKEVAEQGNVEAQVLLAALFLTGEGVKKDETAAYMWLSVEGSRGDADAKRLRDILSRHMSSEQIANAEKLAKEWKPKRSTQP